MKKMNLQLFALKRQTYINDGAASEKKENVAVQNGTAAQMQSSRFSAPAQNSGFAASGAYQNAMDYTNKLLEQLSSGRTSYTDQIKGLMDQIQGREKFSYDADSDPLFQQMLASSMTSGKTAMQDTMGQAAALTGGYGSTYATTAANQAYNAYIQDAYNNLPEYYQLALEAYEQEGQAMYNQLAMLSEADATEYGRLYDAFNANYGNAQQMYQNEYNAWQDSLNNAYNMASLKQRQHEFEQEMNYKNSALLLEQADTDYATLSNTDLSKLDAIYLEAGGGEAGHDAVDEYLALIGKNNLDNESMDILENRLNQLELKNQNWEISKDTKNGWWIFGKGDDHNDEYSYGDQIKTFDDLKEMAQASNMTEEELMEFLDSLREQSTR